MAVCGARILNPAETFEVTNSEFYDNGEDDIIIGTPDVVEVYDAGDGYRLCGW